MAAEREMIIREALELPEPERARLIQDLLDSLSPESSEVLDDAWEEELDRRLEDWKKDPSKAVSWSELKTRT